MLLYISFKNKGKQWLGTKRVWFVSTNLEEIHINGITHSKPNHFKWKCIIYTYNIRVWLRMHTIRLSVHMNLPIYIPIYLLITLIAFDFLNLRESNVQNFKKQRTLLFRNILAIQSSSCASMFWNIWFLSVLLLAKINLATFYFFVVLVSGIHFCQKVYQVELLFNYLIIT